MGDAKEKTLVASRHLFLTNSNSFLVSAPTPPQFNPHMVDSRRNSPGPKSSLDDFADRWLVKRTVAFI